MYDIFSLPDIKFPEGFIRGSATAGHQIEGNNVHSLDPYRTFDTMDKMMTDYADFLDNEFFSCTENRRDSLSFP